MKLSVAGVSLATALLSGAAASLAHAQEPVFSRTYVRETGPPVMVSDTFTTCDPAGQFTLVVENGPGGARRVSSGVILVNGAQVVGPSDFNQHVERIERALTNVAAENTIDVRLGSSPGATIHVTVAGAQSCGMRITRPADGGVVTGPDVLVEGTLPASFGPDVGVTVNGERAHVAGGRFAAVVPLEPGPASLTATARNAAGVTLDDDTVAVTVQQGPAESMVRLRASPAGGTAPLSVELKLISLVAVGQIEVDLEGDGTVDFQGPTLEGLRFTYAQPGLYLTRATVTGSGGAHAATTLVQVDDQAALESLLQARWRALRDALRAGDVDAALQQVASGSRARYRAAFEALASELPQIDAILGAITFVRARGPEAVFEMQRTDAGVLKSFAVRFVVDDDGVWRVGSF
jgi:hypothetical protein